MTLANGAKLYKGTLTDAFGYALKQYDCVVLFVSEQYVSSDWPDARFAALYNNECTEEALTALAKDHLLTFEILSIMKGVLLPQVVATINAYIRKQWGQRVVVFTDTLEIANPLKAVTLPSTYLRR